MGGGGGAADGPPSGARGGGSGGTPRRTSVGGATVGATVDAPLDVASRVQLQRTVRALEEVLPKATSLRELGNARPLLALVHSMGEEGLVKTAELFKEFARGDRDDGLLDADEVKELAARSRTRRASRSRRCCAGSPRRRASSPPVRRPSATAGAARSGWRSRRGADGSISYGLRDGSRRCAGGTSPAKRSTLRGTSRWRSASRSTRDTPPSLRTRAARRRRSGGVRSR